MLVLGAAGGVGLTSVELAKALGAKTVIAAASTPAKLEACRRAGADHLVNYEEEGWRAKVKELTDGAGVDLVVDPVGDKYTEPAVRCLAWGGRLLIVGFAAGEIPRIPANLLLLKGAAAVGVFHGAWPMHERGAEQAATERLLRMVAAGEIRPAASRLYALADAPLALRDMMQRRVTGKVVLTTDAFRAGGGPTAAAARL